MTKMYFYLNEEDCKELKEIARENGLDESALLRLIVKKWLREGGIIEITSNTRKQKE